MKLTQFLKEDNGNYSAARLLSFMSVISLIIDWQKHIWAGLEFNPPLSVLGFVLGVVGVKAMQKIVEVKNNSENSVSLNN